MITIGYAGHVIPMFELAKSLKNHNVTFITDSYAKSYINPERYSKLSSFRMIYTNDEADAVINEKGTTKAVEYMIDHSVLDSLAYTMSTLSPTINALMTKSVNILMSEQYDVIIGTSVTAGVPVLCKEAKASCVIIIQENQPNLFDINLPISYSLLSSKHMTELKYRIYNFAFILRFTIPLCKTLFKISYRLLQSLPQVPGPFYEVFTLRNILLTKVNCLQLFSMPPTLYSPSPLYHDIKYLGGFVDESSIEYVENDLTRWVKAKPPKSVVYVAFGSISILNHDRMTNLIYGLAKFLLQDDSTFALLAFRNTNYENYQIVLNEMKHDQYRQLFMNDQRVKVENRFLQQKWILQQNSVSVFISHCGMGSIVEGLYFEKPIICVPLFVDQFLNAISILDARVGESLFEPPSLWQSFLKPLDFHDYMFSASDVTTKLLTVWRNISYERAVRLMSLEMKHAGGVKKAVEDIELLVNLNGSFDRYMPFHHTLPFYQRYILDVILVYMVLPSAIVYYLCMKCCKRSRKEKKD
ncbi:unnamed protein product [Rotaria sp. Silwood1]|nr:unnamed protein product [Rotaria sp. Silwood1]CAF4942506.1 unnamed protein product [Rotaria sp. Silwood1]